MRLPVLRKSPFCICFIKFLAHRVSIRSHNHSSIPILPIRFLSIVRETSALLLLCFLVGIKECPDRILALCLHEIQGNLNVAASHLVHDGPDPHCRRSHGSGEDCGPPVSVLDGSIRSLHHVLRQLALCSRLCANGHATKGLHGAGL